MNLSESYRRKLKNLTGINEHLDVNVDLEREFPVIFSVLTEEALQRQRDKNDGIPPSFSHNGYHFKVEDATELKKLKLKYVVGGTYNNETIIRVKTQPDNKIAYGFGRY